MSTMDDGLKWIPRFQYDQDLTALTLDGTIVATLLQRVNGTWFVRLDCHLPMDVPMRMRDCTSFENGRNGVDLWAARHLERLRMEIAGSRGA